MRRGARDKGGVKCHAGGVRKDESTQYWDERTSVTDVGNGAEQGCRWAGAGREGKIGRAHV